MLDQTEDIGLDLETARGLIDAVRERLQAALDGGTDNEAAPGCCWNALRSSQTAWRRLRAWWRGRGWRDRSRNLRRCCHKP